MKKLQSIIAILLLVVFVISVDQVSASIVENSDEIVSNVDKVVFPHNEVIQVNIEFDDDIFSEMVDNALNEEYVMADITYNGYTFSDIAIRPKGNSSLKQVVTSDSDRLSFKVDFNKYIDGQNLFGITKLNLNNIYEDETLMKEYLSYEMLDSIDAVASDTTYVALSINGEYHGLYLAVEEVDESFLMDNYGNYDGTLYKPEMGIGADLSYVSDDPEDYTGVSPQDDNLSTDENFVELVTVIDKIVEKGSETEEYKLSDVLNVDSFAKYLALSSTIIHLDTYQSGMFHNYYLYYNTDTEKFEWITWDLNMTFNGFPMSGLSDEEATEFLIDEPVIGEMSNYPLVEAFFINDDYVDLYHEYIEQLINGYLEEDSFEEKVIETYQMIEPYASVDPTAFFDIDRVKESIFDDSNEGTLSLFEFVELRIDNIRDQLSGVIESTNNGKGNTGSLSMRGNKAGNMQEGEIPQGNMPQGGQEDNKMPMIQEGAQGFDISILPDEILAMHEQGLLPEEISAYIDRGELPPRDLMMSFAMEMDLPMPGQVDGNISQDAINDQMNQLDRTERMNSPNGPNSPNNPGNLTQKNTGELSQTEDTVDPEDMIALGISFMAVLAAVIYLSFRKQ